MSTALAEGAGAGPSQRTGTRLGGVVSSRESKLVVQSGPHNTVKTVCPPSPLHFFRRNSLTRVVAIAHSHQEVKPYVYCILRMGANVQPR